MQDSTLNPDISIQLQSPGINAETVRVSELELEVGISKPTVADIVLVTDDHLGIDRQKLLSEPVAMRTTWRGEQLRDRYGMIASVEESFDARNQAYIYRVRMVPRVWRLALRSRMRVHANLSVPDVIRSTLLAAGFQEGLDFELRLRADYPARDYNIQYRETDLDFLRRVTEHWGISFFFEHQTGRDVIVFADANIFWGVGPSQSPLEFNVGGLKQQIYDFRSETRQVPRTYILRDYNYKYPKVGLQSQIVFGHGIEGEEIEYGANFRNEEEAALLTQARRDEILTHSNLFRGHCAEPVIAVGTIFTLAGHPGYEDEKFVVISRHVSFKQTTFMSGATDRPVHSQEFIAAHAGIDYRPARTMPKPRIDGVLHGIIEPQAAEEYGQVDEHGCYRVRLMVDEPVEKGGKPYPVVRLSQPSGGQGYGFHFPLRPGTEVILSFIEGDPDRPIITGTAPNPNDRTPVTAENHARNVIRTESGNEINFDDTKDKTRIKLDTPFMSTSLQLGSQNGPEDGIWAQSNGSLETVASTTTGFISPLQSYWSAYADAHSHFVISKAEKPKGWALAAQAGAVFEVVSGMAVSTYSAYSKISKEVQLWWEWVGKSQGHYLNRIEREIRGQDAATRATSREQLCIDAVQKLLVVLGKGELLRTKLGKKPEETITLSDVAGLNERAAEDPQLAEEPLKSLIAFAVAEEELKDTEDAYKTACEERAGKLTDGDEIDQRAAEEKLGKVDVDGKYDSLAAAAKVLNAALKTKSESVSEDKKKAYTAVLESATARTNELVEGGGNKNGHRQYIDRMKEYCNTSRDLGVYKRDVTGTDNSKSVNYYGQNITDSVKFLQSMRGVYKAAKEAKETLAKMSDAKKLHSAGTLIGSLALENLSHSLAWTSLNGASPLGIPLLGSAAVPRAFDASYGLGAPKGGVPSPSHLFSAKEALNMISSKTATVVQSDEKLFLHGPMAVLAGMASPDPKNPADWATSGGTAAVLGKDVALVSSDKTTEIQSQKFVLMTAKEVDIDGRDVVKIHVGEKKIGVTPHKIVIDEDGVLVDIGDHDKQVVIKAPTSMVTVEAKDVSVTASESARIATKAATLEASETISATTKEFTIESDGFTVKSPKVLFESSSFKVQGDEVALTGTKAVEIDTSQAGLQMSGSDVNVSALGKVKVSKGA